jgi:hypothetical protein
MLRVRTGEICVCVGVCVLFFFFFFPNDPHTQIVSAKGVPAPHLVFYCIVVGVYATL